MNARIRTKSAALLVALASVFSIAAITVAGPAQAGNGITLHNCSSYSGGLRQDVSRFSPPFTGHYWVRVAYYDANMVRLYLSPYYDKGGLNPWNSYGFTFNYTNSRATRALVVWHNVDDSSSVFTDYDYC